MNTAGITELVRGSKGIYSVPAAPVCKFSVGTKHGELMARVFQHTLYRNAAASAVSGYYSVILIRVVFLLIVMLVV